VGEGTESARAEVLAARAEVLASRGRVDEELVRLEASARAAVDLKAKVKRNPVKAAGAAAGAGFLIVGGPRRVLRGTRNAIFGQPDPLPKSMLPKEIDSALGKLGTDGERVRGTIEREFAAFLETGAPERKRRDLPTALTAMALTAARPFVSRYARQLAEQALRPDSREFAAAVETVKARRSSKGS
jgi:hypothetical protein